MQTALTPQHLFFPSNKLLKTTRLIISYVRSAFLDLPSSGTLKEPAVQFVS